MEINLKIKRIEVPDNTYDTLVLNCSDVEISFDENVALIFPKFHDTILGETKILLMKNSFPWATCSGVVLLNNSFFRNGKENCEHSIQILHDKYSNKASSYDFQEKEAIGRIYYEFTRRIYEEDKAKSNSESSGFVQKMFGFFLSDEKAGVILNIKRLMDYINSGSHSCRLNILFGGVLIEKYIAELNEKFTKNINLILEIDNDDLPGIFSAISDLDEDPMVAKADEHSTDTEMEHIESKRRFFRLKSSTNTVPLDGKDNEVFASTQTAKVLSSDGYRICNLKMLLKIKQLFYFTMGSYANSWPSMFISSQKQVAETIPGHRKAVLEILGIEDDDLLCICLGPEETVQHIIFYDRDGKRLVVSFKGTTNSEETIQDINCDYTQFCEGFVHNGFQKLSTHFINNQICCIERLLEKLEINKLLLVGHSLGGAISILVNIMLREMGLLKNIFVETIAFSSPPVVSENIARRFKDGITVINYGNDIIPRMSYGSILDLKFLCCSIGEKHSPLDFNGKIEGEIETVVSYLQETNIYPKLYFPGELIHIKRVRCLLNNNVNPLVVFKIVDLKFFEQIVLIKHAPKHHAVGHIAAVLDESIELFKQKTGIRLPQ